MSVSPVKVSTCERINRPVGSVDRVWPDFTMRFWRDSEAMYDPYPRSISGWQRRAMIRIAYALACLWVGLARALALGWSKHAFGGRGVGGRTADGVFISLIRGNFPMSSLRPQKPGFPISDQFCLE